MALGHLMDDDAREAVASIFGIVRRNVRQFTTTTPDTRWAMCSPLDWIYERKRESRYSKLNTRCLRVLEAVTAFSVGCIGGFVEVVMDTG